jgi:hypothetical protein
MLIMAYTSREQRLAIRRSMLDVTARLQKPDSGSSLRALMAGKRRYETRWFEVALKLREAGVKFAVAGAVGANVYMPPRRTEGLDLAVDADSFSPANKVFFGTDTVLQATPIFYEDMGCWVWGTGEHKISIIKLPRAWGREAIAAAQSNFPAGGMPTLTLSYAVAAKLISARPQDSGDIARMLGGAGDQPVEDVRSVVRRIRPDDADDLDGLIASGRLEFGEA